jgi:hypothetical protein
MDESSRATAATPGGVPIATIGVWLAAAVAAGATGRVATLRPPAPQVVLAMLTVAALAAGRFWGLFHRWAWSLDLRVPVALHLTRVVGFYFLYLAGHGQLPETFALPAGVGDVAVAVWAAVLLISGPPATARRRVAYYIWNAFGLADILFVVASAARHALVDPMSMRAMLVLPLSLLPTFLVPLIIATHVLIFARLRGTSR